MKSIVCTVAGCGSEFKNSKRLSEHKKRKHIEPHRVLDESYLCEICGYCTRFSFNLSTHARKHNGEKPYCCDKCGKCFASLSQLNEHGRVHGSNLVSQAEKFQKRLYKCLECRTIFSSSKSLYHHNKLHLKEKSYECNFCGCTFAQAAGISQHIRQQHKLKGKSKGFPAKITIEKME